MKTPEPWHPSRVVPPLSVFLTKSPFTSHFPWMYSKYNHAMSHSDIRRALNNRWTDGQTDGTDFTPSTANAGGNKPYTNMQVTCGPSKLNSWPPNVPLLEHLLDSVYITGISLLGSVQTPQIKYLSFFSIRMRVRSYEWCILFFFLLFCLIGYYVTVSLISIKFHYMRELCHLIWYICIFDGNDGFSEYYTIN